MRKKEISDQTKKNLKSTFWQLYTEKELDKITVKEICAKAGYNRGTFYLYYKDTNDIFHQIERELLEATTHILNNVTESEQLDFGKHMSMIMEMAQKYSSYVSVLLKRQNDNRFSVKLKETIAPLLTPFLINQDCSMLEKEIIIEFYMNGLLAAIVRWLQEDDSMPIDDFIVFVLNKILHIHLIEK